MTRYQGFLYRLVLLVLITVCTGTAQYSTSIIVTDGAVADTIILGTSPSASFGIDTSLSETELPPLTPPGVFDVRCVDANGRTVLGNGASTDIHPYLNPLQQDTFRISFRSGLSGGQIQFLWQDNISALGAGRWRMVDVMDAGLLDIDMSAQSSVMIPPTYVPDPIAGGAVYIVVQDSARFRTFTMDSLALDADLKGKLKSEKKKGISSRWRFRFANATGGEVNGLVVKYSQAIREHVTYSPFMSVQGENTKTVVYGDQIISSGEEFSIEGFGSKGKAVKAKAYWTMDGVRVGDKFDPVVEEMQILYPMPNVHNLGEELFASGAFLPDGLVAGITGSSRSVVHAKYKLVSKTLVKKGIVHTGPPSCLDTLDSGKPFGKAKTSLPPTIMNNRLVAEQVALKFNIVASDAGRTPTGFGDLVYTTPSSVLSGMTVRAIAACTDTVLSCVPLSSETLSLLTFDDWQNALVELNGSFSGQFDTASWSSGLVLKGAKFVSDVPYLQRGLTAPVAHTIPRPTAWIEEIPAAFRLGQNYPNPFNPTTTISFELPYRARVTLTVTNILGQTIAVLADQEDFEEGETEVEFDGSGLASGAYYYRINVESLDGSGRSTTVMKKMMLLK